MKPSRGAVFQIIFLLMLLYTAVYFSASGNPIRMKLQYAVFDEFNKRHPRERSDQVIIVDIDEKSLEQLGQWPWPRNIMAQLTDSLTEKEAKAIAFDGVFAEKDSFGHDTEFAQAIKNSEIFVTAFTYGREDRTQTVPLNKNRILARSDVKKIFLKESSPFTAAAVNLEELSKAAAGNGSFMARPDSDGVLRRVGMIFSNGREIFPSLSIEALRIAGLGKKGTVKIAEVPEHERAAIDTNYRILIEKKIIPIESDGILHVHYRPFCNDQDIAKGLCKKSDYISAYKFLDPAFEKESTDAVKNKIVLIGASAEGLKDLRSTALQPFRPGVEVHANVIEQILQQEYLLRPAITEVAEAAFILTIGLFFILVAPFIGMIVSILFCTSIIAAAVFGAYVAYVEYGLLIDPVYPSLSVLTIFIVSTLISYARVEARRKQIRNAFSMYVAADVMRDLERNPEKLKLGGENRELTVMFTDIRKFTSISEGLSPEELITLMNEFLTRMTDIVMKHHGTVDKYIGDAMMSFWNAPRDIENHARQACLAALDMQSAIEPVNAQVRQKALELGKDPIPLQVGIGINTGPCAVGNMGSKQRFAYSALGDAVNLASRFEGRTKRYGISIITGEETWSQAPELAFLELDIVQVVGKEQATYIYGLFGDEIMAQSEDFKEWEKQHNEFLKTYRTQNFDKALKLLKNLKAKNKNLYGLYEERIKILKDSDLPEDWDGVFIAQNK